tara:strand:+ start:83 stop:481 length:399 start_codon:yes stop_codon:yes gene_type:complete
MMIDTDNRELLNTMICPEDNTNNLTHINGVKIYPRLTVGTINNLSYWDADRGQMMVNVAVGILPNWSSGGNVFQRRTVAIPTQRVLNGRKPECIRTCRYGHFMNILTSHVEAAGVDLDNHQVVFVGFTHVRA